MEKLGGDAKLVAAVVETVKEERALAQTAQASPTQPDAKLMQPATSGEPPKTGKANGTTASAETVAASDENKPASTAERQQAGVHYGTICRN